MASGAFLQRKGFVLVVLGDEAVDGACRSVTDQNTLSFNRRLLSFAKGANPAIDHPYHLKRNQLLSKSQLIRYHRRAV